MNAKTIAITLIACSFMGGCAVSKSSELLVLPVCPPAPVYPKVSDAELRTLTDYTYDNLAEMIILRDEYINELKAYCDEDTTDNR